MNLRTPVAAALAIVAVLAAVRLGERARRWNDELALRSPLADMPPRIDDPRTPRLASHVVLVIVDGLGAGESHPPFLDELRHRGIDATAHVPYPTISRPNYVTILTGVPPRDSGVRANRVTIPVEVDTIMDRARAAGLRVATASDFGLLASLFLRNTPTLGVDYVEDGPRVHPRPPVTWPVDEARRVGSLDELGPTIVELARDAALVPVLVIDVDRAGHAAGVGTTYRTAAAAVDRMLREVASNLDLAHDTLVVTADHGHVAPGGHGGLEREVSTVPLVIAGAGVAAGATVRDARLVDIAPTIAALLGVPAPGHAEGRTLVEALALDRDAAARRLAADTARAAAIDAALATARDHLARPDPAWLAGVLALLGAGVWLARVLARRGVVAFPRGALAGTVALAVMPVAMLVMTRGHASPSYIPTLARVEELGAIGAGAAVALQLVASWLALRHARDRLAGASGLALVGLGVALGLVGLVRAWFAPPFLDVPSPFWMIAIPTLELGAATCAAALVLVLVTALALPMHSKRA